MNINLPLKTLISALNNIVSCNVDENVMIHRITSLDSAGPNDLAVVLDRGEASVFDPVSIEAIKKSTAGVLLIQDSLVLDKKCLVVKDALAAFLQLADFLEKNQEQKLQNVGANVSMHPTAVIDTGASVGAGSNLGAHVYVGKNCIIGANVRLYPGVKILDRCIVGDHSIIHAGAVIGSDGFGYQVTKMGLKKIPQIGIVRIGSNVEIGANCAIDRASFDETVIGDGVKMDNSVHIAHNVKIGAYTAILAQTGIAGSTEIGVGCQIGGQVAIKDHTKIGNGVKIVSKSGIMNNLKDGETVAGIPAMPFNQWKRLTVCLLKLPDLIKTIQPGKTLQKSPIQAARLWIRQLFE